MPKYHTRQREILLVFLERHADKPLSAEEIAEALKNENISLSAVYRNLADLEKEGKLLRHSKGGSRKTYYQYTHADCCKHRLHLSCKRCGKISHMDKAAADNLISGVASSENFSIDQTETVLIGLCAECKEN